MRVCDARARGRAHCIQYLVDKLNELVHSHVIVGFGISLPNVDGDVLRIFARKQNNTVCITPKSKSEQERVDHCWFGEVDAHPEGMFSSYVWMRLHGLPERSGWIENTVGNQKSAVAVRQLGYASFDRIVIEL